MIIDIVLGRATGKGGLEKVVFLVSNELSKRGHRVRVFQMSPPDNLDWAESLPDMYYYGNQDLYQYSGNVDAFHWALGYRNLIEKIGLPDLILATHTPLLSLVCRLALSYLGPNCPPILSWLHGPPESYGGGMYLKYSDAHLAISRNLYKKINESLENKSPVYYIGNPVEINNAKLMKRPKNNFEFIYIGRLENGQKRLDILLKALSNVTGNWSLRIVGDGESKNELELLASKIGISGNIIWDGWKEDPWANISEASALLLSSDYEGFGLVLVEALSRGIPVVSTNCEGPDEIIQDDKNGWLYPVQDYVSLQNILQEIIDGKKTLPDPNFCRESVLHYRTEVIIDHLEEVLNTYLIQETIQKKVELFNSLSNEEVVSELFELIVVNEVDIESVFSIIEKEFPKTMMCEWLTQLGVAFWQANMLDFVIPAFQKALEFNPHDDDALFNLGYILKYIGEEELALHYLEKINEKNDDVWDLLNEFEIKSSGKKEARDSYNPGRLISVLIPTYNRPNYFIQALESAINQTFKNIEIIVCDNSQNNETKEIIEPYLKENINLRYYKNEENLGMVGNMRKCLHYAHGELIAFLLDDDMWAPTKLEKIAPWFNDEKVQYVTSPKLIINENNEGINVENKIFDYDKVMEGKQLAEFALVNDNFIGEPSVVVYRKSALELPFGEFGGHTFNYMVDLASWFNILKKGKAVYIDETLTYFRRHQNNLAGKLYYKTGIQEWLDILQIARENGYLQNNEYFFNAFKNLHHRIISNIRNTYSQNLSIENEDGILDILNKINQILVAKH
jgi:UDP-D-galactose:(glucosyl)LPS alpha-1,6-D-galactosyltransferase